MHFYICTEMKERKSIRNLDDPLIKRWKEGCHLGREKMAPELDLISLGVYFILIFDNLILQLTFSKSVAWRLKFVNIPVGKFIKNSMTLWMFHQNKSHCVSVRHFGSCNCYKQLGFRKTLVLWETPLYSHCLFFAVYAR